MRPNRCTPGRGGRWLLRAPFAHNSTIDLRTQRIGILEDEHLPDTRSKGHIGLERIIPSFGLVGPWAGPWEFESGATALEAAPLIKPPALRGCLTRRNAGAAWPTSTRRNTSSATGSLEASQGGIREEVEVTRHLSQKGGGCRRTREPMRAGDGSRLAGLPADENTRIGGKTPQTFKAGLRLL